MNLQIFIEFESTSMAVKHYRMVIYICIPLPLCPINSLIYDIYIKSAERGQLQRKKNVNTSIFGSIANRKQTLFPKKKNHSPKNSSADICIVECSSCAVNSTDVTCLIARIEICII